jgi:hypothetical protein
MRTRVFIALMNEIRNFGKTDSKKTYELWWVPFAGILVQLQCEAYQEEAGKRELDHQPPKRVPYD